jgi:hypothetical protein
MFAQPEYPEIGWNMPPPPFFAADDNVPLVQPPQQGAPPPNDDISGLSLESGVQFFQQHIDDVDMLDIELVGNDDNVAHLGALAAEPNALDNVVVEQPAADVHEVVNVDVQPVVLANMAENQPAIVIHEVTNVAVEPILLANVVVEQPTAIVVGEIAVEPEHLQIVADQSDAFLLPAPGFARMPDVDRTVSQSASPVPDRPFVLADAAVTDLVASIPAQLDQPDAQLVSVADIPQGTPDPLQQEQQSDAICNQEPLAFTAFFESIADTSKSASGSRKRAHPFSATVSKVGDVFMSSQGSPSQRKFLSVSKTSSECFSPSMDTLPPVEFVGAPSVVVHPRKKGRKTATPLVQPADRRCTRSQAKLKGFKASPVPGADRPKKRAKKAINRSDVPPLKPVVNVTPDRDNAPSARPPTPVPVLQKIGHLLEMDPADLTTEKLGLRLHPLLIRMCLNDLYDIVWFMERMCS